MDGDVEGDVEGALRSALFSSSMPAWLPFSNGRHSSLRLFLPNELKCLHINPGIPFIKTKTKTKQKKPTEKA